MYLSFHSSWGTCIPIYPMLLLRRHILLRPMLLITYWLAVLVAATGCVATAPSTAADPPVYYQPNLLLYEDHTYSPTVHTVQLFKKGFEMAPPVIDLNGRTNSFFASMIYSRTSRT